MGQYYNPILLKENYKEESDPIKRTFRMVDACGYRKMVEHAVVKNWGVKIASYMIKHNTKFPFVWCGDYTENIINDVTLYKIAYYHKCNKRCLKYYKKFLIDYPDLKFVINHTTKEFIEVVDFNAPKETIHPLPILTADVGTGGGGDYYGTHQDMVGKWAYNVIQCSNKKPRGYTEIKLQFIDENR